MPAEEDDAEAIEDLLRAALRSWDTLPEPEAARARDIFSLRSVDSELAELTFDSTLDPVGGLRSGATGPTMLTFEAADTRIEVEFAPTAVENEVLVTGQLDPPSPGDVTLEGPDQAVTTRVDVLGRFLLTATRGPVRLRLAQGDRDDLVSEPFVV